MAGLGYGAWAGPWPAGLARLAWLGLGWAWAGVAGPRLGWLDLDLAGVAVLKLGGLSWLGPGWAWGGLAAVVYLEIYPALSPEIDDWLARPGWAMAWAAWASFGFCWLGLFVLLWLAWAG